MEQWEERGGTSSLELDADVSAVLYFELFYRTVFLHSAFMSEF